MSRPPSILLVLDLAQDAVDFGSKTVLIAGENAMKQITSFRITTFPTSSPLITPLGLNDIADVVSFPVRLDV